MINEASLSTRAEEEDHVVVWGQARGETMGCDDIPEVEVLPLRLSVPGTATVPDGCT